MSIKMKKSDLVITVFAVALILAAALAGLAGCQEVGLDVVNPATGVDSGDPGRYTPTPRIEIYWDGDTSVDRAGKEFTWHYDSFAETHLDSSHLIAGAIFNAPAGFDYLVWSITGTSETGVLRGAPTGPQANSSWFALYGGKIPGTGRLRVWNTDKDGRAGTLNAFIDIRVGGLPSLDIFVTETRTVPGIGPVAADIGWEGESTDYIADLIPQWFVRGGNAGISAANGPFANGGYSNVTLTLTGFRGGATTYVARRMRSGEWVETEGPLNVIASTTWYVGPDSSSWGTYGFRSTDIVKWSVAVQKMGFYYRGDTGVWPGKGRTGVEQHGVFRFTGNVTGSLNFTTLDTPQAIDLVNDSATGQKTLSGDVTVGAGKTLTLTRIRTTGSMAIGSGAQVTMAPAEINGTLIVSGRLTMQDGILNSSTSVQNGGTLTIQGTIGPNATINVEKGGTLTIRAGTVIGGGARVYRNGEALTGSTNPKWLPDSLTYGALTADFTLAPR